MEFKLKEKPILVSPDVAVNYKSVAKYMNRKEFIAATLGLTVTSATTDLSAMKLLNQTEDRLTDEKFWLNIRNQFVLDDNFIDFRANGTSSIPRVSMSKFLTDFQYVQAFPSDRNSAMNRTAKETLRKKLARQINCSEKEIAVMRNTTEALNNAIMGIPLGKGDEIVASVHDVGSTIS